MTNIAIESRIAIYSGFTHYIHIISYISYPDFWICRLDGRFQIFAPRDYSDGKEMKKLPSKQYIYPLVN